MKPSTKVILMLMILVLIIAPLIILRDAQFGGADGEAEEMITQINPDYEPWFNTLIEPASGEIESLLFATQAAVGAFIIAYYLGYQKGKKRSAANR